MSRRINGVVASTVQLNHPVGLRRSAVMLLMLTGCINIINCLAVFTVLSSIQAELCLSEEQAGLLPALVRSYAEISLQAGRLVNRIGLHER